MALSGTYRPDGKCIWFGGGLVSEVLGQLIDRGEMVYSLTKIHELKNY